MIVKEVILKTTLLFGFSTWYLMATAVFGQVKPPTTPQVVEEKNLTAVEILKTCTKMIPQEPLLLSGMLTVRKLRGIVLSECPYKLLLDWGAPLPTAEVLLLDKTGNTLVERAVLTRPAGQPALIKLYSGVEQTPMPAPSYAERISGTDMTWLDLTLDFLWWQKVRIDDPPRGDSRNGHDCDILVACPPHPISGCSAVRVWVARQYGCVVQTEQLDPQGQALRKMWVQRIKKIDDRWMIRDMEIETLNSGHRTRLFVDTVSTP